MGHGRQRADDGIRQHGRTSATGVAFTPRSGQRRKTSFYGEYLINAQGEDVVAGVRTPHPIAHLAKKWPAAHKALMKSANFSSNISRTCRTSSSPSTETGSTFFKRGNANAPVTPLFASRSILVGEKLISKKTRSAASRPIPSPISSRDLDRQSASQAKKIAAELAAGRARRLSRCFQRGRSGARSSKGQKVVLARIETSPEDLRGMIAAEGILTSREAFFTAALVGGKWAKVCVCARAGSKSIIKSAHSLPTALRWRRDYISIDGTAGEFSRGK